MKTLILSLIFISSSFANYAYTYGQEKGKIDMHGGKGEKLTSQSAFGVATTLGSVLNKKSSKEDKKKEDKNFIEIEKIEKIENKGLK